MGSEMGSVTALMLRWGLLRITGLIKFRLDLLDAGPDLGERHVIGRLDLGANLPVSGDPPPFGFILNRDQRGTAARMAASRAASSPCSRMTTLAER